MAEPIEHPGWAGWYFEDGYLCTPTGDRFTAVAVHACFFWRQLSQVASLMQSDGRREDSLMELTVQDGSLDGRWIRSCSSQRTEPGGDLGLTFSSGSDLRPGDVSGSA